MQAMQDVAIKPLPIDWLGAVIGSFGVADGRFGWARFYLEPVDAGNGSRRVARQGGCTTPVDDMA